jgi:hypothetical protein
MQHFASVYFAFLRGLEEALVIRTETVNAPGTFLTFGLDLRSDIDYRDNTSDVSRSEEYTFFGDFSDILNGHNPSHRRTEYFKRSNFSRKCHNYRCTCPRIHCAFWHLSIEHQHAIFRKLSHSLREHNKLFFAPLNWLGSVHSNFEQLTTGVCVR